VISGAIAPCSGAEVMHRTHSIRVRHGYPRAFMSACRSRRAGRGFFIGMRDTTAIEEIALAGSEGMSHFVPTPGDVVGKPRSAQPFRAW
jgi:hypothetical protein